MMLVFSGISLVMLLSITPSLFVRQLLFFVLGFFMYAFFSSIPFTFFIRISKWIYVFMVLFLIATFLIGHTSKGSTRWISLGFAQIQPSQIIKPFFAIYLSLLAVEGFSSIKKVMKFVFVLLIPLVLVFIQPDLGTTLVLSSIGGTVLLLSGMPKKYLFSLFVGFVLFSLLSWNVLLKEYQKQRIFTFISPSTDEQGTSYHAKQSLIAVGSGKIFGRGLGHGVQSHLRFLPEKQTDFMFASLSEEMGFLGSTVVVCLYGAFFVAIIKMLSHATTKLAFLSAAGILSMLLFQTTVNIGMNIGLLPITGITLPLLSYGGSSILAVCMSLGIVVSATKSDRTDSLIEIR